MVEIKIYLSITISILKGNSLKVLMIVNNKDILFLIIQMNLRVKILDSYNLAKVLLI